MTASRPIDRRSGGSPSITVLAAASASLKVEKKYMPDYSERFEGVFVHESSYVDDGVEIGSGTKFGTSVILATRK